MKPVAWFSLGAAAGALMLAAACFFWSAAKPVHVYVLDAPMLLAADSRDKNLHLLPKGTTLYYDQGFPEGVERYRVYVNLDHNILKLKQLDDPTRITPIRAQAIEAHELKRALRDYPLTKTELQAILKSDAMTRAEIKAVFDDFLHNSP
ncbi:hypothetical protein [Massilia rubra]|uniref:Transmembrane protein n=1 Tax=Massilia rubra TaxID=2607910 RepID=A0ABX0LPV1_9BURK|nr:hypothetical protein [Massilia rubra]NHZ36764.1 hypothetical protein [Massilia rubra]